MERTEEQFFLLEASNLSKTYEGQQQAAVFPLNLQLQEREIAALVGGSGSGKTTLLRLLAGLEEADSGNILFRREAVKGPADQLIPGHRGIRLVHQHFELAHRLSVYDNVGQKLRHLHPDDQKMQTSELLEVCRLSHLRNQKVEALSGGEKQRLALARTLAEEPALLLLDEPFSNLDPVLKEEIKEELFAYIRRQGIAAILVSHDPKDALSLADTLWVLQDGRLLQKGTPGELYYQAFSPAVARLFGKVNSCLKEELAPYLEGEALTFLQDVPDKSLLGFRPEVLQLSNGRIPHLQARVLETYFHGALTEVKVLLGEKLSLSVYLPGFYATRRDERVNLRLQLNQLQVWKEE